MPVEIPPEIVRRVVERWDEQSRVGVAEMEEGWAERVVEEALREAFAAWSERLTSDEAVDAGALALAREVGEEFVFDPVTQRSVTALAYRLSARKTLDAALSSVSGKDGADG